MSTTDRPAASPLGFLVDGFSVGSPKAATPDGPPDPAPARRTKTKAERAREREEREETARVLFTRAVRALDQHVRFLEERTRAGEVLTRPEHRALTRALYLLRAVSSWPAGR